MFPLTPSETSIERSHDITDAIILFLDVLQMRYTKGSIVSTYFTSTCISNYILVDTVTITRYLKAK